MKNNLILLILITCSVGCTSLHEKKKASKWEGNFMFFQMADTQLGYGKLEQDIKNFNQAIAYANQHKPDFVVICGDLLKNPYMLDRKDEFLNITKKLNKNIPLYLVSGNHDVMEGKGTKSKTTAEGLKWHRKHFGDDYYSFEHKGCYGIILNSSLIKSIEPGLENEQKKQKKWMLKELEKAKARKAKHIFIFQHHPYFFKTLDEKGAAPYFHLPKNKKEYFSIFHQYDVRAVFAGHWHRNSEGKDGDIEMITTGQLSSKGKVPAGFRVVHVFQDKIEHKYYGLNIFPKKIKIAK